MRGYFAMGVEQITKPRNVGNLIRSSHAFGASFFYTINPVVDVKAYRHADTSDAFDHMPFYNFETVADLGLPKGCELVGVEFLEEAVELSISGFNLSRKCDTNVSKSEKLVT